MNKIKKEIDFKKHLSLTAQIAMTLIQHEIDVNTALDEDYEEITSITTTFVVEQHRYRIVSKVVSSYYLETQIFYQDDVYISLTKFFLSDGINHRKFENCVNYIVQDIIDMVKNYDPNDRKIPFTNYTLL